VNDEPVISCCVLTEVLSQQLPCRYWGKSQSFGQDSW